MTSWRPSTDGMWAWALHSAGALSTGASVRSPPVVAMDVIVIPPRSGSLTLTPVRTRFGLTKCPERVPEADRAFVVRAAAPDQSRETALTHHVNRGDHDRSCTPRWPERQCDGGRGAGPAARRDRSGDGSGDRGWWDLGLCL